MAYKNLVVICCLIFFTSPNDGAKILAVFPMASPSHYILGNALLRGLADAGHDVTMISPYTENNPPKRGSWRDIVLTGFVEEQEEMMKEYDPFEIEDTSPILSILFMGTFSGILTEKTLNHTNVQNLIRSHEKFDVIIAGQFFNEAVKALSTHFNAHLVIFSSLYANSMLNHLVGNPSLPSFAPEVLANFPPKMSFFQRLYNTLIKFTFYMSNNIMYYPKQNELIKKYFSNTVELDDVMYNASLVLLNSHPSITTPQPYVPCMVEIGGFHIKPPKKLPDDLQSFLDSAKEGVVYFSLGSNLKSKNLPVEKRNEILRAFSKLKEKVLWKWEDDVLPGQTPNVKLGKWLPQQDILAHPNVKLFITHGGLLSTTETIYHGVPIIAIPIFGDQKINANSAQAAGYGTVLPFKEISEERLSSALEEMLTNPKYREEAQRRSKIMHDRQVKPLDNAVYWVEYVIRHNGAKHLRVAYLDLTWYQYYLLDVLAFIFAVIVGLYFILRKITIYCIKRFTETKLKKS